MPDTEQTIVTLHKSLPVVTLSTLSLVLVTPHISTRQI